MYVKIRLYIESEIESYLSLNNWPMLKCVKSPEVGAIQNRSQIIHLGDTTKYKKSSC